MRKESQARELALQALYQWDLAPTRSPEEVRESWRDRAPEDVCAMAAELLDGCARHRAELDRLIRRSAENWELERMATSDRNILRLGAYELLHRPGTPPKVAINEAIELAKRYSTENSPTFVNGVLDRIYHSVPRGGIPSDPGAKADLHVHSTASDGSVAPEELPGMAAGVGLAAIALTDHDSVEGVEAAREAGQGAGILVVPGVELTAYIASTGADAEMEMHVAGLFVDPFCPSLLERLEELRRVRVERVHRMVSRLRELGLAVSDERVLERAKGGSVGRAHLAQELVEEGHCATIGGAFERYLCEGGPVYVPKEEMTPRQAIDLIHAAAGCAVLCHPGLFGDLEKHLPALVGHGLDAIEVHYPTHSAQQEKELLELAREHDLLVTGGSDFHGSAKPDIRMGQETVTFVELQQLHQRAMARV